MNRFSLFLGLFSLVLLAAPLSAQTSNRTAAERAALAETARNYERAGSRLDKIQAADAWFKTDSFANLRAVLLPLAEADSLAGTTDSIAIEALHGVAQSFRSEFRQQESHVWSLKEVAALENENGDVGQRATAYGLLGETESKLGLGKAALEHLRIALDAFADLPEKNWERWLQAHWYYIDAAVLEADVTLTDNAITATQDLLSRVPDPTNFQYWYTHFTCAKAAERIGELDRALGLIDKAMVYALKAGDPVWEGTLYNTRGLTLLARDGFATPAVFENMDKSIAVLEAVPGQEHNVAYTRFNLGFFEYQNGNYTAALERIAGPVAFFREQQLPAAGTALQLLASIRSATGDYEGAKEAYSDMVRFFSGDQVTKIDGIVFARPDSVDQLNQVMEAYKSRAYNFWDLGKKDAALRDFLAFADVQDIQRARYRFDESRRVLSESGRIVYDDAIELCKELADSTGNDKYVWQALQLSERAKAYSLMKTLDTDLVGRTPEEMSLRYRIAKLERQSVADTSVAPRLAASVLELESMLAPRSPSGQKSFYLDREALTNLVATLGTDVLEYHFTEGTDYLFHLSPAGQLSLFELDTVNDLNALADDWRTSIRESAYRTKSLRPVAEQQSLDSAFLAYGTQLRDLLLPRYLLLGNRVCIVPDGLLHYFPFAALPAGEAAAGDYANMTYFNSGREVYEAYSLNLLSRIREGEPENYDLDLIGFAPTYQGVASAGEASQLRGERIAVVVGDQQALPGLRPLEFNGEEVQSIAEMVGPNQLYFAADASKGNFVEGLGRARVLHISGHGVTNTSNPNLSYLAFSQTGDSLRLDELLFFNDLTALPVDAGLVVLSACETNLGPLAPGETPLSMASAFTAAGARSTLTTFWQIDDAATKELMTNFYAALTAGKDKATALREAQEALLTEGEFAHPYYWSGAVLHGNNEALALAGPVLNYWLLGGIIAFGAGAGFVVGGAAVAGVGKYGRGRWCGGG